MVVCTQCDKECKTKTGLAAHVRAAHTEVETVTPQSGMAQVPARKISGEFKVGDIVRHTRNGEKFKVEEVNYQGHLGRKVNQVDPLRWYKPTEVHLFNPEPNEKS